MPDDGQQNIDASALQSVVSIIKDMEIKVSFNLYLTKISIRHFSRDLLFQNG